MLFGLGEEETAIASVPRAPPSSTRHVRGNGFHSASPDTQQQGLAFPLRRGSDFILGVGLTMPRVSEINRIDQLAQFREVWQDLLRQTAGASFFQSLEWLEVYWRHFGQRQKLRALVVFVEDRPVGILPLVVQREKSKVGRVRTLTFPLHEWGSFYGPIGPDPELTLTAGLEHIHRTPRDWDIVELRWQGAVGTDPSQTQRAMLAAGFQSYATLSNRTAIVDLDGNWDAYWSAQGGVAATVSSRRAKARRTGQCFLRAISPDWPRQHFQPLGEYRRWGRHFCLPGKVQHFWQTGMSAPLASLGPLRRLRGARPAKLAGDGHRRHDAVA